MWRQALSQPPHCRFALYPPQPARYTVTGAQNNAAGVVVSGGNAVVTGTSGPFGGRSQFATVAYQG